MKMKTHQAAAVAAFVLVGLTTHAMADELVVVPPAAQAFLKKRAERLNLKPVVAASKAVAGPQADYVKVDNKAPVLKSLAAIKTDVDASKSGAQLALNVSVTDDYAGVSSVSVNWTKPNDYGYYSVSYVGYPDTSLTAKLAIDASQLSPGDWAVDSVQVTDAQGNYIYHWHSDLEALGFSVKVHVVGAAGDTLAPSIASGKILTPTISVSTPQKGTLYRSPRAGFSLTVQDTGEQKVSGVREVAATFCIPEQYSCLNLGHVESARGQSQRIMRTMSDEISSYMTQGVYKLTTLTVSDFAGNSRTMTSIEDGGDTDFSTMFPSTTITLVP